MRVVGLRLEPGQRVPEHRNAIPVALIVTVGRLHFDDGSMTGAVGAGEMMLINPGERHTYRAEVETSAYLVFAGLPGVRSRPWSLRRKASQP
jgi:quercetin dioxygenase-like cupin family protein